MCCRPSIRPGKAVLLAVMLASAVGTQARGQSTARGVGPWVLHDVLTPINSTVTGYPQE